MRRARPRGGTIFVRESMIRCASDPITSSRRSCRSSGSEVENASTSGRSWAPPEAAPEPTMLTGDSAVLPRELLELQPEELDEALGGAVVEAILDAVGGERVVVEPVLRAAAHHLHRALEEL